MLKMKIYDTHFFSEINAPSTKLEWSIYKPQNASKMSQKIQIPKILRHGWYYHRHWIILQQQLGGSGNTTADLDDTTTDLDDTTVGISDSITENANKTKQCFSTDLGSTTAWAWQYHHPGQV